MDGGTVRPSTSAFSHGSLADSLSDHVFYCNLSADTKRYGQNNSRMFALVSIIMGSV
jgi:hypothetical protein